MLSALPVLESSNYLGHKFVQVKLYLLALIHSAYTLSCLNAAGNKQDINLDSNIQNDFS